MVRRIILDTDTGVDDALAICLALRSPELRVEGITAVHGNVPVDRAASNIGRTLDVLRPTERPPVAKGADRPLVREPVYADDVHGWDGLGGATHLTMDDGRLRYPESSVPLDRRSAVELIHDLIAAHPGEVTLVAVGPLTNVAEAIRTNPERMEDLAEIVVMGGTFRREGNMSPVAEFNIFADPHAAREVFEFGVPLTLIPLDVTETVVLTRERVETHAGTRLGRFVRDVTAFTMDFAAKVERIDGTYVHDALAVATLVRPELFRFIERRVEVETEGTVAFGQTVADLREPPRFEAPPNARIAVGVDAEGFLELFESRVLAF